MQYCNEESLSSSSDGSDLGDCDVTDISTSSAASNIETNFYSRNLKNNEYLPEMTYELQQGFRILKELMAKTNKGTNQYFMNCIISNNNNDSLSDYNKIIKQPIWLKKIKLKFLQQKYCNISEFVSDMRLLFENCYRYYGPDHPITKKGIRLEVMMEQKLALLPRDLREKTTLEITSKGLLKNYEGYKRRSSPGESSLILNFVKHEKALRDKEIRKKQMEEKRIEKEEKEKEILEWEDVLLKEPLKTQMKASWELPQIAQFLFLCSSMLQLPTVSLFELERILLMPRESSLLNKIITSLLYSFDQNKPVKKLSLSYKSWTEKLKHLVQGWYNLYHTENSPEMVFEQAGIEPPFFCILGENNLLLSKEFHELTFHQRIWLLKSLCDHILHVSKSIQDIILDQPFEFQRETCLGTDSSGNAYLYFPQFTDHSLRIYRQGRWTVWDNSLDKTIKNLNNTKNKQKQEIEWTSKSNLVKGNNSSVITGRDDLNNKKICNLDYEKFELVVDSIQTLEILIKDTESKNVPRIRIPKHNENYDMCAEKNLLCALKKLLADMKQDETKLQMTTHRLRHKLYKEWNDFKLKSASYNKSVKRLWTSDENYSCLNKQNGEGELTNKSEDSYDSSSNSEEELSDSASVNWKKAFKRKADVLQTQRSSSSKLPETLQKLTSTLKKLDNATKTSQVKRQKHDVMFANGAAKGLLMTHLQQNTALQAKQLFAWETLRQNLISSQSNLFPKDSSQQKTIESNDKVINSNVLHTPIQPVNKITRNELPLFFTHKEKLISNTLVGKEKITSFESNTFIENRNEQENSISKDSYSSSNVKSFNYNLLSENKKTLSFTADVKQSDSLQKVALMTVPPSTITTINSSENKEINKYENASFKDPIKNNNGIRLLKTTNSDKIAIQKNFASKAEHLLTGNIHNQSYSSKTASDTFQSVIKINSSNEESRSDEGKTRITAFNSNDSKPILLLQTKNLNPLKNSAYVKIPADKEQIVKQICSSEKKIENGVLLLSNIKQNGKPVYFKFSSPVIKQEFQPSLSSDNDSLFKTVNSSLSSHYVSNNKETLQQPAHSNPDNALKISHDKYSVIHHKANGVVPIKKISFIPSSTKTTELLPKIHNCSSIFVSDSNLCSVSSSASPYSIVQTNNTSGIPNNPTPVFIRNSNQLLINPNKEDDTMVILSYPSSLTHLNSTLRQTSQPQVAAAMPPLTKELCAVIICTNNKF